MSTINTGRFAVPNTGTILLPSDTVNTIAKQEHFSTTLAFQRQFGMFGSLTLNDLKKYISTRFRASGSLWRAYQACGDPDKAKVRMESRSLEACPISMQLEYCNDPALDNCYAHLAKWSNGEITDGEFSQITNLAIGEILAKSYSDLIAILTLGKYYGSLDPADGVTLNFPGLTTEEENDSLLRLESTCEGLLFKLKRDVPTCNVIADDVDNCAYAGDIVALYDALKCCAAKSNPALSLLLDMGRMAGSASPVFLVDPTIYSAFIRAYTSQNPQLQMLRISREVSGGSFFYYIDGVPVVPYREVQEFDPFTGKKTLFVALTVEKNIEFGSSYANIPSIESKIGSSAGVVIYRDPNPTNNKTFISAHALLATTFDPDWIVWDIMHVA